MKPFRSHDYHRTEPRPINEWEENINKFIREDKTEKTDWTYITDLHDSFERIVKRFMLGEKKYSRLNFRNCEDYKTYEESALRHLIQYLNNKTDEDHLAACIVNLLIIMDGEKKCFTDNHSTSCTCCQDYVHKYYEED